MRVKPGKNGFKLEDSLFSDHFEDPNYNPEEFNPNHGFKVPGEIITHVRR